MGAPRDPRLPFSAAPQPAHPGPLGQPLGVPERQFTVNPNVAEHVAPGVLGQLGQLDSPSPSVTVDLLRPDDLLNLHIEGYNLKLDTGDPAHPTLVRADAAAPAYLAVQFPLQHVQEQAFFEVQPPVANTPPTTLKPLPADPDAGAPASEPLRFGTAPARARAAGPSRLVFRLPDSGPGSSIPYTTAGLLNWSRLTPNLSPRALPPGDAPNPMVAAPAPPSPLETAIELPYRLLLSPDANATWAHDVLPVTHASRTELWHTRLVLPAATGPQDPTADTPAFARALWSRDYDSALAHQFEAADPFRASLTPYDRRQVVRLSSDYRLAPGSDLSRIHVGPQHAGAPWQVAQNAMLGAQQRQGPFQQAQATGGQAVAHPAVAIATENVRLGALSHLQLTELGPVRPIAVERLMLSPLGGWLTSRGAWDPLNTPDPLKEDIFAVSEWRHMASQGRDQFVRVVYEGYLFPFGHRASLIKVTERKFLTAPSGPFNGTPFAYLRQHMYVVVRQPTLAYSDAAFAKQGREMPLKFAQLTTLVTPDILPPEHTWVTPGDATAFWVTTAEGRFPFHVHTLDAYGHPVDFTAPLIFMVGGTPPQQKGQPAQPDPVTTQRLNRTRDAYIKDPSSTSSVRGQKLTYAPPIDPSSDTTTLTTDALAFDAQQTSGMASSFIPLLRQADVRLPSVEQLVGKPAATTITFFDDYLTHGFPASGPGVFAQLLQPVATVFSADKAGGIATPNMSLVGLSRQIGPVAGLTSSAADLQNSLRDVANNVFNPAQFFTDAAATLFGTISLPSLFNASLPASDHAPKITTVALPAGAAVPTSVVTSLEWHPPVTNTGPSGPYILGLLETTSQTKFDLSGKITKSLTDLGGAPSSDFKGSLTSFTLHFFGIIGVAFDRFAFHAQSGHKTDVTVNLVSDHPVTFDGPLAFVNSLQDLIPSGGFGDDGPTLSLTPTEAKLGYTLAIPPVSCGVLSVQHMTFGAALTLPFLSGAPLVDFNFAERAHPFLLTVEVFGGGGFLHVQLDTQKVRLIEGAFEFGGNFSLDIGVASGGVHVLAGIYFKLGPDAHDASKTVSLLDGFVRMGGELSVLGLISASLEFDLDLSYESSTHEARGQATLTIAISIAFFSTSVDLTVERSFGGSPGDPTFQQVVSPSDWATYAAAFG